jgi:hypothetical protein
LEEAVSQTSPVSASEDLTALGAAHQIEALPSDLHPAQKTARIQLIVLDAMRGHAQTPTEPHETTYLRGWNEGIERSAEVADAARESAKEHHGIEASIGADIAARRIRALADTSTVLKSEKGSPVGWGGHLPGKIEP